jgi:hypothetical protein
MSAIFPVQQSISRLQKESEHTLHQLKGPYGLSKLFPFMYILDSIVKCGLH